MMIFGVGHSKPVRTRSNPFEPVRTRSDPFEPLGNATICCLQTRTRSAQNPYPFKRVQKAFKSRSKTIRYPFGEATFCCLFVVIYSPDFRSKIKDFWVDLDVYMMFSGSWSNSHVAMLWDLGTWKNISLQKLPYKQLEALHYQLTTLMPNICMNFWCF